MTPSTSGALLAGSLHVPGVITAGCNGMANVWDFDAVCIPEKYRTGAIWVLSYVLISAAAGQPRPIEGVALFTDFSPWFLKSAVSGECPRASVCNNAVPARI